MSKVVGLRGAIPAGATTEPVAEVIEFIDALMQEALEGRLRGIAVVKVDTIGSIETDWTARGVERHLMLAGTTILNQRICNHCLDEEDAG
jgi:hypothetical protein